MFKAIKDNKIIAINDSGEFPCMIYDSVEEDAEHQLSDYVHCDGQFVLTVSDEAIEQKKAEFRAVRNQYLEETDKYVALSDFPITDEEREQYKAYRVYLRDYTLEDEWWLANPKTFEEYSEQLTT